MRQFAGLTLSAPIPEDTTIMNFRHLLEKHQLAPAIFAVVNGYLQEKGLSLRQGTIIDAISYLDYIFIIENYYSSALPGNICCHSDVITNLFLLTLILIF